MTGGIVAPGGARSRIVAQLRAEIVKPQPPEIAAFAHDVARHYGGAVAAVLFYGSCLRTGTTEGVLDFYVLVDGYRAASLSALGAVAARLLPPAVYYHSAVIDNRALQAKVAVMSRRQFERRMRAESLDTSLWARFCQPAALVFARDPSVAEDVSNALAEAMITASLWAARLGPDTGAAEDYWRTLFRATYGAELRVESSDRAMQIYAVAPERYKLLLSEGWCALGFAGVEGRVANPLSVSVRQRSRSAWGWYRAAGKMLNVLRLTKAAFTFRGGADYVAWKIERHTGQRIELTAFQRRHPLLAAPVILWHLVRHGIIR